MRIEKKKGWDGMGEGTLQREKFSTGCGELTGVCGKLLE
jgi:hypothetical protein